MKFTDINVLETLKIIHKHENSMLPNSLQNSVIKCSEIHDHNTRQRENYHLKNFSTHIAANTSVLNRGMEIWNGINVELRSEINHRKFSAAIKKDILEGY